MDKRMGFVVLGTACARGILFMSDSLGVIWCTSGTAKGYSCPSFHPFQPYRKYGDLGRGPVGYGYRVNPL